MSLSEKMLFASGGAELTGRGREVLSKVAAVLNAKSDQEVLIEGHTDSIAIRRDCFKDNWDLSALRATAVTRILQKEFKVDPARITAAGRGEFVPLAGNSTPEGRSRNRRIRVVMLPKLDQFYGMVEQGLKDMEGK